MASIRKEVLIKASPDKVWDALSDIGALHTRLVPGFVTDTRMDGNARVVTFGNGMVAREEIVDIDARSRRLVWSIVTEPFEHHNGVAQVFDDGKGGSRFIWTADLLPDALAPNVDAMMEQGIGVIKQTLERAG